MGTQENNNRLRITIQSKDNDVLKPTSVDEVRTRIKSAGSGTVGLYGIVKLEPPKAPEILERSKSTTADGRPLIIVFPYFGSFLKLPDEERRTVKSAWFNLLDWTSWHEHLDPILGIRSKTTHEE